MTTISIGMEFGKLIVIERLKYNYKDMSVWMCKCSCGKIIERNWSQLLRVKYPSCGCWVHEITSEIRSNRRGKNRYEIIEDICVGYYGDIKFFFDYCDYDLVSGYLWHTDNKGYLKTTIKNRGIFIHRLITNCPNNLIIDHIDGNPLNNRRSNLRMVTHKENQRNKKRKQVGTTSKYFGVSRGYKNTWRAQIRGQDGKVIKLGTYENEIDAAIAYNKKSEEFGYLTRNDL